MAEKRLQTDKNDQRAGGLAPPAPAPPRPMRSASHAFVEPPPHPQSAEDSSTTTPNGNLVTNTNVPLIKTPNSTTVTGEEEKKTRAPTGLRRTTRRSATHGDGNPAPESYTSNFDFDSTDNDSDMIEQAKQATVIRRPTNGRTKWTPESWKVE